ncbi:MAG: TauD/TfdA dioxygenase family protein, partial [Acidimicrobiales bacterium]
AFAERFGIINVNRFFAAHSDHPQIALVIKEPDQEGNIGGAWHTDHSYDVEPALGSILVARELPASGGDTKFASMAAAWESLDDATKEEIADLDAIHSSHHVFGSTAYTRGAGDDYEGRFGATDVADSMDDVIHPVVIVHPLSGKPTLYVNPGFTIGVVGMDEEKGRALLQRLFAHAAQPQHVTRFEWKSGSIAFWDNRAMWHNAMNDYPGQRRAMHRITIDGCPLERA